MFRPVPLTQEAFEKLFGKFTGICPECKHEVPLYLVKDQFICTEHVHEDGLGECCGGGQQPLKKFCNGKELVGHYTAEDGDKPLAPTPPFAPLPNRDDMGIPCVTCGHSPCRCDRDPLGARPGQDSLHRKHLGLKPVLMTGVCCGCQTTVGVHYDHQERMWLTDNHNFMHEHCDGSCMKPQVVFADGKMVKEDECFEGRDGDV
jgi:hypothetical protein